MKYLAEKKGRMLKVVVIIQLLVFAQIQQERLTVLFWNLENFFDYNDTKQNQSDTEFSPSGARHWTKKRFYTKCNAIAKSILWVSETYFLPDLIGVAEVENRFVLKRLVGNTALKKLGYEIIHYDSPDPRGIDVALLYNRTKLKELSSEPIRIEKLKTRDILLAKFETEAGNNLNIIVNHHPSKFGGKETSWRRETVINRLKELCEMLLSEDSNSRIIAMGDFNEEYDNEMFEVLPLVNVAAQSSRVEEDKGTIRYRGKWEFIDLFFVSEAVKKYCMRIVRIPFLQARDRTFPGEKPFRTYIGPTYSGGVSDHYPVLLELSI